MIAVSEPPGETGIAVHCPANGLLAGHVPERTGAEVAEVVHALRSHQPDWEQLGARGRARWLGRFRDWIFDHDQQLIDLIRQETGKPWQEAALEVTASIDVLNYYAEHARRFLADETPWPHNLLNATKRLRVVQRPYQLVGVITPWNFPVAVPMLDVMPALMAGCAVITKPSEVTPLAWSEMVRGWREDLDAPAVLACVTGRGAAGAAVVDEVDFVQFTGSTSTGRQIARRAGERLIPYGLELGGKDAMIVLADCDLDRTVDGAAWGGLFNSGQTCVAVERVYVEAPIYDEFVTRLARRVSELRQGFGENDRGLDVGPMATEAQLTIVERHVRQALDAGASALTGGKRAATGLFFEPTVLVDVDHSMECMREETFGPTLPVMRVADADEAIRLANDSPYGLSASVWTGDRAKAERIAARLDAGAVNVNSAMTNVFAFSVPHGGWKQSGIGARLGGASGIRKYCRPQAIVSDRLEPRSELFWYPYTARKATLVARVARAVLARDLRRRIGRKAPR
jgi:acyl-CoA reductase-like NAD-dependent aldehyde dehydrogenase